MSDIQGNWHPDPSGRHQLRFYNGTVWTDHVSDDNTTSIDPLNANPGLIDSIDQGFTIGDESASVQRQLTGTGLHGIGLETPADQGGGTIFTEPILVVNQKAKLIEITNEYSVFDQQGRKIAAVTEVNQSTLKKLLRLVSKLDQFMSHSLAIVDGSGQAVMTLTRPPKLFKSTIVVSNGANQELGRIVQENMIGKIRFGLIDAQGQRQGTIKAENWRAWNFSIIDNAEVEIARVTKTWEGLLKTAFTTADNYVIQILQRAPEPLNSLIIASALSIDTALKQDSRGFN